MVWWNVHLRRAIPSFFIRASKLRGLDGISADQIGEHLALYTGCPSLNALTEELAVLRERGRASGRDQEFAELPRRLGFEYYFSNLRAGGEPRPAPT